MADHLRVKLMLREAIRYAEDAQHLHARISHESNGGYLLELLALEILLKCCVLLETGKLERGHDYVQIFLKLNRDTRETLICRAAERFGPNADFTDVYWLLALYGSNFVSVRYPYESYSGMSEADYFRLGVEWVDRGALIEEAKFDFRPMELKGFFHALSTYISEKIVG